MAFSIIQQPPALAPARSPVRFVLSDPEYIVNAGSSSTFMIQFAAGSTPNETVRFHYQDVDITMRCKSVNVEDGITWPAQSNAAASAFAFVQACNRNYFLFRDFIITRNGSIVQGISRNKGVYFGADGGLDINAPSIDDFNWTSGAPVQYHEQHYVGMAVHVEEPVGSGTYIRLPDQVAYHTPENATVSFDISSWLRPYLMPDPVPYGLNTAMACDTSCRRYFLAYWGRYKVDQGGLQTTRGQQAERAVYVTSPSHAFLGGYERAEFSRFWAWWAQTSSAIRPFLTYRGRVAPREVTPMERHYLNFYNTFNPSLSPGMVDRIALKVRAHYYNQPDSAWVTAYDIARTDVLVLSCWAVGYSAINIEACLTDLGISATGIVGYSVKLVFVGSGANLTESYRFELVQPEYQEIFIQWVNSLGAWESTRFTGTWSVKRNADYAEHGHILPYTADGNASLVELTTEPLGSLDTLTVNSGLNSLHEHKCLLDILNAPAIRMVDMEHGRFIPLRIVENSEQVVHGRGEEDENIHQLTLSFVTGNTNVNNTVIP